MTIRQYFSKAVLNNTIRLYHGGIKNEVLKNIFPCLWT